MGKIVLLGLFLAGCGSAAIPVNAVSVSHDEDAMSVVWEGSYGMEHESRPRVEWFADACRTETGAALDQIASTTYRGTCIISIVHSDGRVELAQTARVSDSRFAAALRQWKQWLLTTEMAPHWYQSEVDAANAALESNGL